MAILCFDMRVKFYDGIPKSFPEIKGRLTLASQPIETGTPSKLSRLEQIYRPARYSPDCLAGLFALSDLPLASAKLQR